MNKFKRAQLEHDMAEHPHYFMNDDLIEKHIENKIDDVILYDSAESFVNYDFSQETHSVMNQVLQHLSSLHAVYNVNGLSIASEHLTNLHKKLVELVRADLKNHFKNL